MDQVFLFTFNGVLIVFERRKKSRIDKDTKTRCKQFFPASSLPIHRASDNFPAKN